MLVIRKWQQTFENADTRKRVRLGWFHCPSGVDSAGYIELMSHGEKGLQALGVFIAICQWSATCVPEVRGMLVRSDGRELSIRQLSSMLRIPEKLVQEAVDLLSSADVGWLVSAEQCKKPCKQCNLPVICHQSAGDLLVICHQCASGLPQGKGKGEGEGQGEGQGEGGLPPTATLPRFVPPTIEDVLVYARSIKATIDVEKFHDHYTANGWRSGGGQMKDWKAAVRYWAKKDQDKERAKHESAAKAGFTRQAQQDAQFDAFREFDRLAAEDDERDREQERLRQIRALTGGQIGGQKRGPSDHEAMLGKESGTDDPF